MSAYYSTAINNGGIYIQHVKDFTHVPIIFLDFIIKFPLLKTFFGQANSYSAEWANTLRGAAGSNEFTNINPFLGLASDISVIGMLLFVFSICFYLQRLHRALNDHDQLALISYSIVIIGFLDFSRIEWWTQGRAFPMIIGLAFLKRRGLDAKI